MKIFLLRWFINWCTLIQGLIGIFTLGLYRPSLELWAAKNYSRAKFKADYGKDSVIQVEYVK